MSHWSFLKAALPEQRTGISPFILLQGDVSMTSVIAIMKGTSTSCWPRRFYFRAQWRSDFIPCGLALALLFPNYSPLSGPRLQRHGPSVDMLPSMCFCDWQSPVIITCTSLESWAGVLDSTWWDPLEHILAGLFTVLGVLPTALQYVYHTELLLLRCCPSYRELNAVAPWWGAMALSQRPVVCSTLNPQMHRGSAWRQAPQWTHRWYWQITPKLLADSAPESIYESFHQDGRCLPWCHLQKVN